MKLVKCILMVHVGCLCQAFRDPSTETNPTDLPATTNITEDLNSDPYVHPLSGQCHWTLRTPGNGSSGVVPLAADRADALADRICRDLGCGSVYYAEKTSSAPNATCFRDCFYRDARLQNCSRRRGSDCAVITEAVCGDQAVRLSGGSDRCSGRVELWRGGRWGTVCDDQWDARDADVVCRQLGCGYALSVTGQGGSFPPGSGPVHLDDLNCTGTERNLWSCPSTRNQSDCGHKEDAGVVCSEMRAVRLSGGLDRCSGRVEIHRNGSWGTVCDTCWNTDLASMVCSMLRCGSTHSRYTQFDPPLGHDNNGTRYYYQCFNVPTLWQCGEFINKLHLCETSKASGVICNGSLGFPEATTANASVITTGVTESTTTLSSVKGFKLPPPEMLVSISLSILLLVFLVMNTVLCCHYRRRHAFLVKQTHFSRSHPSEQRRNSYEDAVDLVKVTANPVHADVPSNPRHLWTQLSSVDSTSVDTDYEQYEPSNGPSVPLSTFRNSQRYRTDLNPLMRPPGLDSLSEEALEPTNGVAGVFMRSNGCSTRDDYARVSKVSVDSFDETSSCTSSDEGYANTQNNGVAAPSEPLQSHLVNGSYEPSRFRYSNDQLHPGQTTNPQNLGDEDDGGVYSPVSPDCDSSTEDDYDDVGA